jgi:hypothetical protein
MYDESAEESRPDNLAPVTFASSSAVTMRYLSKAMCASSAASFTGNGACKEPVLLTRSP